MISRFVTLFSPVLGTSLNYLAHHMWGCLQTRIAQRLSLPSGQNKPIHSSTLVLKPDLTFDQMSNTLCHTCFALSSNWWSRRAMHGQNPDKYCQGADGKGCHLQHANQPVRRKAQNSEIKKSWPRRKKSWPEKHTVNPQSTPSFNYFACYLNFFN